MLTHAVAHSTVPTLRFPIFCNGNPFPSLPVTISSVFKPLAIHGRQRMGHTLPHVRRMIRSDDDEDYGHNEEMAMIESYSEMAKDEVLLVRAVVDDLEEEVIVFKGFSSSLSDRTSPDPSKSVLPARAVIKSIDIIQGPFDPSNIEYLEKGITWKAFKSRLRPIKS